MLARIACCCAWAFLAQMLTAATYYTSLAGSDANPGTESMPFRTVAKGLAIAQPGDLLLLGAGNYAENITTVRDGISGSPITLDGRGAARVNRIYVDKAFHVFQNLTIAGETNAFGKLFWLRRNGHSTILSNSVLNGLNSQDVTGVAWDSPSTKPFGPDAASNCLIVSNRITGILGDTAISVAGDNNLIVGNYVHDLAQSDFLRLWGRTNVVRGNTFTNIYPVAGIGNHIDFVQTFGTTPYGSWGHIIENNKVIKVRGGQLSQLEGNVVPEIGNWTFRNNLFALIDLGASCSIPQIKYYNNVFYRCNTVNGSHPIAFGSRAYTTVGYHHTIGTNRAHGAQVFNNIFLDCADERLTRGWYGFSSELTNVAADYNYVGKLGYKPVAAASLVGSAPGEPNYDGMKFFEYHGINGGYPGIVSPGGLDFRLLASSILIDAGTGSVGSDSDLLGTTRPQGRGVDIGPYEFLQDMTLPEPPSNVIIRQ